MPPIDLTLLRETLALHDRSYRLLLWLGNAARETPELLSADNVWQARARLLERIERLCAADCT